MAPIALRSGTTIERSRIDRSQELRMLGGRSFCIFMKRFRFTLEPVRAVRKQEEQLIQVELATALRERTDVSRRLDDSRAAEVQIYTYLRETRLSAQDLSHITRFLELHRQKIVDAVIQLRHTDDAIERIRVRLAEARARREALDKLEAKQREAHRMQWLAEQARELDEIGTMRHARRNANGGSLVLGGAA